MQGKFSARRLTRSPAGFAKEAVIHYAPMGIKYLGDLE